MEQAIPARFYSLRYFGKLCKDFLENCIQKDIDINIKTSYLEWDFIRYEQTIRAII